MKRFKIFAIVLVLIIITISCCNNPRGNSTEDPLSNWLKINSYEIETLGLSDKQNDLNKLKQIVGDAKVVCLGESRHDIREQFQLKHRFIKYLVEEMDFSIFILEASLPYAERINTYLQNGEENIDEILANMPGWFLWDTEEISDIISWMREFNADPVNMKKLQFYGIDIVAPGYGLNSVFDYLSKVDVAAYEEFQTLVFQHELIDDNSWQATFQRISELPPDEKSTLRANYMRLYGQILQNESDYITRSGSRQYDWILRLAYCAQEAIRMFTAESRLEMGLIRDSAMADNTLWIKSINSADDKSIIWAHNVHITKGEFTMTGESESIKGMGYILGQELKDDMVVIGASFNQGEFENWGRSFPPADKSTIDGTLAKLGMKYGMIDLRGETNEEEVLNWLNTDKVILGQEFEMTCIPANSFDAIFFIDNISRTIPNPVSMVKFRNMN